MLLQDLYKKKLIHPPQWLPDNTQYLVILGSVGYGINLTSSDFDLVGWVIPKKSIVFPHTIGILHGFGNQGEKFEQWIEHHIFDKDAQGGIGRNYDFTIFSIVKFFNMLLTGNPSSVESLFVAQDCVLHCTQLAQKVRDNRKIFLNKNIIPALRGYAMSQYRKVVNRNKTGKRAEEVEEKGLDLKALSHTYRLALEAEQILANGDLDLRRDRETIKFVRTGAVTFEDACKWFQEKEIQLQKLYDKCTLPHKPNEEKIKQLLFECLEIHYGSLEKATVLPTKAEDTLRDIKKLLEERGY